MASVIFLCLILKFNLGRNRCCDFSKGGRLSVKQNSQYSDALEGNSSFISYNKVLKEWKKRNSRGGKLALISGPYDSVFIC